MDGKHSMRLQNVNVYVWTGPKSCFIPSNKKSFSSIVNLLVEVTLTFRSKRLSGNIVCLSGWDANRITNYLVIRPSLTLLKIRLVDHNVISLYDMILVSSASLGITRQMCFHSKKNFINASLYCNLTTHLV